MDEMSDGILDMFQKLPEMVLSFAELGPVGWIAGGIFAFAVGIGAYLLWKWAKDRNLERVQRENEERQLEAEGSLPGQVTELTESAQDGQAALRNRVAQVMLGRLEKDIRWLDISVPVMGVYKTVNGWPRGAVIHYTAGRPVLNEEDAAKELRAMAAKGLGSFLIGDNGAVYGPKAMGMRNAVWHAGESHWKGVNDVSRVCMGIEISCAGKLEGNKTWWGDVVHPNNIRTVAAEGNIKSGDYMRFTNAQEEALLSLLMVHVKHNPDFDIEWIVGHDEVAPDRKQDPGGSLSLTMPKLREVVRKMVG